jgi:type IV secretion system protein VirB2
MAVAGSLFDPPAGPVLAEAGGWITGTLFGDLAASLCVIAVAFVGILLMMGRLAVRDGLRVVLGCFVLLGAPIIATGLRDAARGAVTVSPTTQPLPLYAEELPPAD